MEEKSLVLILCLILLISSGISAVLGISKGAIVYKKDSPSAIAQEIAQDAVTIFIIIPLFIISIVLLSRNNVYGNIFVAGLAGYFLYNYASYSFYFYFNRLFLINVIAFSSALFLFIISTVKLVRIMESIGIPETQLFIGGIVLIIPGILLLYLWLSQLVPATIKNVTAPILELSQGKMAIQVKDLGVIAPALIGFGLLLVFSRDAAFIRAWLLILLFTGTFMFTAVTAMAINETRAGFPDIPGIIIFALLTVSYSSFTAWTVLSLQIKIS